MLVSLQALKDKLLAPLAIERVLLIRKQCKS